MLTKGPATPLELRYLDPEDVHIFRGEDGLVYATIRDEVTLISPAFLRSHPLTDPERYISIKGTIPKEGMRRGAMSSACFATGDGSTPSPAD